MTIVMSMVVGFIFYLDLWLSFRGCSLWNLDMILLVEEEVEMDKEEYCVSKSYVVPVLLYI